MKISVITVCFNSAKTIERTITSVLSQTYENYEYIIVDGGSTDETLAIIRQYEPLFGGRLRMISERDNGIYDAMNKGIDMAAGDVISLINSDDMFFDDKVLGKIATIFYETKADVVYSDVWYFSQDPSKIVRKWNGKSGNIHLGWIPAHPGIFVRRDIYRTKGKFDTSFRIAADYDFLLRIFIDENLLKVYFPSCTVLMSLGGTSTRNLKNILRGNEEVIWALKRNNVRMYPFAYLGRILRRPFQFIWK